MIDQGMPEQYLIDKDSNARLFTKAAVIEIAKGIGITDNVQFYDGAKRFEDYNLEMQNLPCLHLSYLGRNFTDKPSQLNGLLYLTTWRWRVVIFAKEPDIMVLSEGFIFALPRKYGYNEGWEASVLSETIGYSPQDSSVQMSTIDFNVAKR